MTANEYLEKAKSLLNTKVDADLARRLHISGAALCQIKKTGHMSDDTADELAQILGIEPALILLDVRAARSHNKRIIASVRRVLQQAGLPAFAVALMIHEAVNCILCQIEESREFARLEHPS